MKIAFNPSTVAALITPPNNKDITFDLRGRNIFARGVKFCGTDTQRDIKINNVSIGSNILDLRNGSNTTLTNTNGVVTINSTWRPVVDNLTSDSTTSSLSAKQGKILKSLIDGKSNSGHTHDDRYLKLTGGTMASNALITFADSGSWGTDKGPQGARGGLYWTGQSDYAKLYAEETAGDNLDLVIQFGDDNSNGLSIRNKANTQTSYISAGGVITTGTFKGNLDWSYITNKPSSYTPSAHTHAWNSLTHSSTTENQAILTNGKANGWKLYTLNISRWDNAANNAHSHSNKSVLDGITSALVNNWNIAYNFVSNITGTDTDKVINKWDEIVNFLAGITEDNKLNTLLNSKLSVYELANNTNVGTIKNNGIYYSTTDASSGTLVNSPFNTGFALINMTSYDNGDDLRRSRLAFNAYGEIKVSNDRDQANTAETWYNVLTSKNSGISGSTIKLNGTSITVYSSSTADGRYVKKSGDTMTGVLTIDTTNFGALTIKRNDDANGASIQFRGKSSVYGYIGLNNSTKDKQFLRWSSDTSKTYTILDTSSTYTSNGKGVINGTTITQVDNATNSTNSTNARKLVNWYSARPTSLNTQFGDGSLRIFYATSSTTEGKPAEDSHILHLAWDNNGGWDTQLAVHTRSGKVSTRAQNSGTWQPWKTLAFTTDIPSSLKNPHALTISLNGTSQGPYDGSAAKSINITPGSIGAAVSNHSHDYLVVNAADDKSFNSAYHNFQVLYAGGGNGITGKPANVDAFGLFKFRAASGWSGQMLLANGGSLYIRSSEDAKITNTLAWKTILDSSNYSGILDSRYYTESEVDSLLDAKLNRQNLSYGTWNPRGYNLAADYYYNGGDLSISENDGKMYVSIDGQFYQNEGKYRVLDTSDISSIRGGLTLYQHLSATDATRYPLVWGGSDHKNTNNSTGSLYKSYDKLSWQTSNQTLYATNIQTENIKHLSIGGGIYWNPYVESTTDGSDAASITLVKSGVAGGTTLVLSQMNDANDTIQFQTNGSARLYHNSYPILTTQNTYVSGNKGYINGTEITQVNNADTVDGAHLSDIKNWSDRTASVYWKAGWYKVASAQTATNTEAFLTLDVNAAQSNGHAILFIRKRADSKPYFVCIHNNNLNLADFRLYYNGMSMALYARVPNDWNGRVFRIISEGREGTYDHIWTLYRNISSTDPNAISAEGGNPYINPTYSGRVDWSNSSDKATRLQTSRTLWGQSFDGTTDVDNTLRIRQTTGNYCEGIRIQTADSTWATIVLGATGDSGTNANAWSIHRKADNNFAISRNSSDGTNGLVMTSVGMGLGTTAPTQRLDVHGNIRATGQIIREASDQSWVNGRKGALLRETTSTGYHTLWSLKTTNGSWDFGEYNSSGWNNIPVLSYITDTNFNSGNNTTTYQIKFPLDSGTIALTKNIPTSVKNPYSLTTFGVVYDGSAAKVVSPSNFISQVNEVTSTVTDGTMFITSWASNSGFADTNAVNVPYKRKAIHLWEYIKAKTDSLYATKSHNHDNKYLKWLGNAGQSNMNAIGRISHSSGMTNLSDPGNTIDNPMEGGSKSTSWHLYWQTNYTDDPSSSNAWVAQIVNRAGTDRWWVRSRSGGTITNGANWTSNWRFLVTAPTSGLGNGNQPVYINSAGEVVAANSYPTSLKNPHSLTLKANGTTLATYDGSSAKEANFTYANVGAASASHTHDDRYVRKWTGVYGSANKFLKLVISDEKGWIRLEVSDSNNALSGGYGIYIIGWGYHGNNSTDTLFARCLYANDSRYTTALKIVRTSRNNYDFYFQFASGSSYPSYTINYSSSVSSIDCTVTAIDTIPTATWTSSLSALQLNASQVDWSGITNKPSVFNPAAHTHTVFKNNLMIKGTNGVSDSASIHLGIGDSDTGFKWISDGKCQIYANNSAVGEWTSGGMNWFKNPTVNGNKVWNAGNDGSGSGLDADTLDGYHENSFLRYRETTSTDQEATLWNQIGIKTYHNALPDGLTGVYNYGSVISLPGNGSRFEIYASHQSSSGNGLYYRSGWNSDKKSWLKFIDSSNIGSQTVASSTKLQTARKIWGQSFDGTADISGNMSSVGQITFSALSGTNGRALLYQQMADNDYFRIYAGGTASNSGYVEIATADDGNEPIYVRQYTGVFSTLKRTLTLLDGNGNTILPGSATATGFNKSGSSNSYVLLGGGSHKAISDFMLKTDELSNNLTTISKSLTVTQAWMDTGIKNTDLPANGTYIIQVSANNTADYMWSNYWSGIMSWYKDGTNDSETDEIILHRAGHAYHHTIYLRTIMTTSSDGRHLRLQIAADINLSTAVTYTFKFKRVI